MTNKRFPINENVKLSEVRENFVYCPSLGEINSADGRIWVGCATGLVNKSHRISVGNWKDLVLGQLLLAIKMLWYQYLLRICRMSRPALQCMYYVLCNHIIDIKSLFYVSSILATLGIIAFLRDAHPTMESGCSPYSLAVLSVNTWSIAEFALYSEASLRSDKESKQFRHDILIHPR